jgi:hypothetical protein
MLGNNATHIHVLVYTDTGYDSLCELSLAASVDAITLSAAAIMIHTTAACVVYHCFASLLVLTSSTASIIATVTDTAMANHCCYCSTAIANT